MAIRSFQRSIRFTKNEWDTVVEAAEKAGITPARSCARPPRALRPTISISTAAA